MEARRWNWHLWAGFLICLVGFASYPVFFVKFPVTRDVPWVNFLLLAAGLAMLFYGLTRVGQQAPEFELADINNQPASLAKLLSTPLPGTGAPPKGVLLVFYRGYW